MHHPTSLELFVVAWKQTLEFGHLLQPRKQPGRMRPRASAQRFAHALTFKHFKRWPVSISKDGPPAANNCPMHGSGRGRPKIALVQPESFVAQPKNPTPLLGAAHFGQTS